MKRNRPQQKHIVLTSHPNRDGEGPPPVSWGAPDVEQRGPILGTLGDANNRNVIGTHSGSYALYRALAIASKTLDPVHVADLTNTSPAEAIGPHPQWSDPDKIVSIDPYGHIVSEAFADHLDRGWDIRPTIAVTKAHINLPEMQDAMATGRLKADGDVLTEAGQVRVTKVAIEPVWHLPGVAKRFGIDENDLRRSIFEQTGGMFPELVTRPDLHILLPPIGGATVYCIGDLAALIDPARKVACRVHDECNGSDVFGSDICTCRPYLTHGVEVCIEAAQAGGAGIVVYNRKEGRGLGEVTKFLVYNARKRQAGGDRASAYFERTECVAGVQDVRFQELMPDVLHWLGITRIDRFVSMSDQKHDAITRQGIEIGERVEIPAELIPQDAWVEIEAKKAAGYYTTGIAPNDADLDTVTGRELND